MNLKSIYETLTALGTGALIVGCGAPQTPVDTAEGPAAETASKSETKEASDGKADAPIATPTTVASSEEKPTTNSMAASSQTLGATGGATPAGATPAGPTPAGATPAAPTTAPVAAKAKPVAKKPAATATTGKTTGKKKDAGSACGEGGCG